MSIYDEVKTYLNGILSTGDKVARAVKSTGKSRATLYRYKNLPDSVPVSVLRALEVEFGPIRKNEITWEPHNFLIAERALLKIEQQLALIRGERLTISPLFTNLSFTKNVILCSLDAFSDQLSSSEIQEILRVREERRKIYCSGAYSSSEIFNGYQYLEFFQRRNRYRTLSIEDRDVQINQLIDDIKNPERHGIKRRVYFSFRLPSFTCYSDGSGFLHIANLSLKFLNPQLYDEVELLFKKRWADCRINRSEELIEFLLNPEPMVPDSRATNETVPTIECGSH